ncbi:MAG: hypothetical protein ABIG28_02425 [archaeon]
MMNRKGMFFIILAVVLISFFLLSFTFFSVVKDRSAIQKRVETLNNFVFAVEEDIERRLFISGYRIIFLFEKRIIEEGSEIDDVQTRFEELFYNGTLYGTSYPNITTGVTFFDIEDRLESDAGKIGANLSFFNPIVSITQDDPWHVKISLTVDFVVEDLSDLVRWNKTLVSEAFVPIEGFGDPMYSLNTNSKVFANITQTPYTDFVDGNDVSDLKSHLLGSYYIDSAGAPSFLNRLEGVFTPDVNGIESLVNLDELAVQGVSIFQKSVVDYIYFSTANLCSSTVSPTGMPSWFRLDKAHETLYEVTTSC